MPIKYRAMLDNGYIETLTLEEAQQYSSVIEQIEFEDVPAQQPGVETPEADLGGQ